MKGNLAQAICGFADGVFLGPNGDYPAVQEILEGVSVEEAQWKPAEKCNSIWQIVDHLRASKRWLIDMLAEGKADSPIWAHPGRSESEWETSKSLLREEHLLLRRAVESFPDDALLSIADPQWNQTYMGQMLSIIAREAFHAGQLDYLKGMHKEFESRRKG